MKAGRRTRTKVMKGSGPPKVLKLLEERKSIFRAVVRPKYWKMTTREVMMVDKERLV